MARAAVLWAFVAMAGLSGCGEERSLTAPAAARTQSAPGSAPAYVATAVGRIDSVNEARQLVAAVDGVIAAVHVRRGDRVKAGQTLLEIACEPRAFAATALSAQAEQANAAARRVMEGSREQEIEAARQAVAASLAARTEAAERLTTAQALVAKGFVSRRDLSARENAMAAADAEWRAATAQASLAEEGARAADRSEARAAARAAQGEAGAGAALARQCTLASPIDGEVLQILRREGEFSGASQGTPLIIVADLSRLQVRAEVAERDAARVKPDQIADIWIEGTDQRWRGKVRELASVMGRRSARSLDPTDRFDRDVREVFITLDPGSLPALVGLRVTAGFRP